MISRGEDSVNRQGNFESSYSPVSTKQYLVPGGGTPIFDLTGMLVVTFRG